MPTAADVTAADRPDPARILSTLNRLDAEADRLETGGAGIPPRERSARALALVDAADAVMRDAEAFGRWLREWQAANVAGIDRFRRRAEALRDLAMAELAAGRAGP